jgi:hypothetical protein
VDIKIVVAMDVVFQFLGHQIQRVAFGFSTNDSLKPEEAWLPQSSWWGKYSVDSQDGVEGSTLSMYREALALRKQGQDLVMDQWSGLKRVRMLLHLNVLEILPVTSTSVHQFNYQATVRSWLQVVQ